MGCAIRHQLPAQAPLRGPFAIGALAGIRPVLPAPMAGISDRPARDIAREMGCNLVYTEMIAAEAVRRRDAHTIAMIDTQREPCAVAVQVFGADPASVAEAARILQEGLGREGRGGLGDRRIDAIDINAGCPARKIVDGGSGAGLLKDLPRLAAMLRETRRAVSLPLTLKYRSAWDDSRLVHLEVARIAEGEGLDAIALHPRTRAQAFGGAANWDHIAEVKRAVAIPVIGNGDVWTGADARHMVAQTGCDAVMIGRGAMGNPWVLRAALEALALPASIAAADTAGIAAIAAPDYDRPVSVGERLALLLRHAEMAAAAKGERRGVIELRKLVNGYLKGVRQSRSLRLALMRCESLASMRNAIGAFMQASVIAQA